MNSMAVFLVECEIRDCYQNCLFGLCASSDSRGHKRTLLSSLAWDLHQHDTIKFYAHGFSMRKSIW